MTTEEIKNTIYIISALSAGIASFFFALYKMYKLYNNIETSFKEVEELKKEVKRLNSLVREFDFFIKTQTQENQLISKIQMLDLILSKIVQR